MIFLTPDFPAIAGINPVEPGWMAKMSYLMMAIGVISICAYVTAAVWLCIRNRKRMKALEPEAQIYGPEGSLGKG